MVDDRVTEFELTAAGIKKPRDERYVQLDFDLVLMPAGRHQTPMISYVGYFLSGAQEIGPNPTYGAIIIAARLVEFQAREPDHRIRRTMFTELGVTCGVGIATIARLRTSVAILVTDRVITEGCYQLLNKLLPFSRKLDDEIEDWIIVVYRTNEVSHTIFCGINCFRRLLLAPGGEYLLNNGGVSYFFINAHNMFDKMSEMSQFLWTVVNDYAGYSCFEDVVQLLRQLGIDKCRLILGMFAGQCIGLCSRFLSLIPSMTKLNFWNFERKAHNLQITLLKFYDKCRCMGYAQHVFEEMCRKNSVCFEWDERAISKMHWPNKRNGGPICKVNARPIRGEQWC